jgi:hypothetical protein
MLHVNEDNNDELFRKAAEDYCLGTDNPDWQTFINKMNSGVSPAIHETVTAEKKRNYRFLSFFFTWIDKRWYKKSSTFLRIFRFSVRSGKTKKKINHVFFLAGSYLQLYNYFVLQINEAGSKKYFYYSKPERTAKTLVAGNSRHMCKRAGYCFSDCIAVCNKFLYTAGPCQFQ